MTKKQWYVLLGVLGLLAAAFLLLPSRDTAHRVTLTWQAPAPRTGITVIGFNVYRRILESSSFVKIGENVPGPPYEDHLVTSNRTYVYVVTTVDATGRESRFSAEVKAQVPSNHFLF